MKTIRYDLAADGIATLLFDDPSSAVNTMNRQWQEDLLAARDLVLADKDKIKGILLASGKPTFFAGADLRGMLAMTKADAQTFFEGGQRLKKAFRDLETMGKPIVALINGTALGGGFELALVGHHRIMLDNPKFQLGFPEVTLGLLPGASGVTKTVRMLGLMAAMPYLVEGKLMSPQEALKAGFIHDLAKDMDDMRAKALAFIEANPTARHPFDVKDYKIPGGNPSSPAVSSMLPAGPAMLTAKTRGLFPAPEAILSCMVEGARVDFETATRLESRYLAELATGQVAKNMITAFFFNLNAIKAGASRPKDIASWKAKKVGILGAGMMGAGIAYANASRGIPSVLRDVTQEKADFGKSFSQKLTDKKVQRGGMSKEDQAALLDRITATASLDAMEGCDLIIEAVFENRELKAQVTKEAEPKLAKDGFFASNTSTLPISGLAKASARPEKFVGIHFFSPVDKMRLVEIIKGEKTDAETLARAYDYVQQIGKVPIVVNDSRGFFTSRVFGTFVMEGIAMLEEGIPAAAIENIAKAAGMPVGPLEVVDQTSLSLSKHVADQTRKDFAAEGKVYETRPGEALVDRMVDEFKRPGRAGGAGFYDYPKDGPKSLWPDLKLIFEKPGSFGGTAEEIKLIKDRILYRQAVETARCLEEGVLTSEHDGNIGSIFAIGFPAWTGGALQFIRSEGVKHFIARSEELAARFGDRFAPPAILKSWV